MHDIVSYDRKRLVQCLFMRPRVFALGLSAFFFYFFVIERNMAFFTLMNWALILGPLYGWVIGGVKEHRATEFINPKMKRLWDQCQERLAAFEKSLREVRKAKIAKYEELPKTVEGVAKSLYVALRRADIVMREVGKSEGVTPPPLAIPVSDRQAQELYRIADKNLAEYRTNFSNVVGSVQRAEAQGAVFITTLDNLRIKLLSHRLSPKQAEDEIHDFLYAMTEAKLQLDAIDHALEELELGPVPTKITILADQPASPPPVEEQHLKGGNGSN